jgi:hypothetical protein
VVIARGKRPLAHLLTVSSKPRERVITVDDEVVHRCTLGTDYSTSDDRR